MTVPHVLLLGGHGKVAQLLTPLLLQRSWNVTSIIRNPDQIAPLEKLGGDSGGSGKLTILVRSIDDIKSEIQAKAVIDDVKPDYVVWSAGAGGKGAPERVCVHPPLILQAPRKPNGATGSSKSSIVMRHVISSVHLSPPRLSPSSS